MRNKIIPVFVPHQGCPHDCIFCNQTKITGVSSTLRPEDVDKIICEALETIPEDCNVEIAFFGGSFTAIDIELQKEFLKIASSYKERGLINDIRLSTRPDCIDEDILSLHKKMGTTIIELGVQSMDAEVLEKSIRGHDSKCVYESADLIRKYNIRLGLQMMTGLPGDTPEKSVRTALEFVKIGPEIVRIYPTLTIRETGLEELLNKDRYKPQTLEEAIELVSRLAVIFDTAGIKMIRVGLQDSDDIRQGANVLDGPYHPGFFDLVRGRMYREVIDDVLGEYLEDIRNSDKEFYMHPKRNILIYTYKKTASYIAGNKRVNRKYFFDKYKADLSIKDIRDDTQQDTDMDSHKDIEPGGMIIICDDRSDEISYRELLERLANKYGLAEDIRAAMEYRDI